MFEVAFFELHGVSRGEVHKRHVVSATETSVLSLIDKVIAIVQMLMICSCLQGLFIHILVIQDRG